MIADMAAPDELPIVPRTRRYPERITYYGGPRDLFLRVVDVIDEAGGSVHRTVVPRPVLERVSAAINGHILTIEVDVTCPR